MSFLETLKEDMSVRFNGAVEEAAKTSALPHEIVRCIAHAIKDSMVVTLALRDHPFLDSKSIISNTLVGWKKIGKHFGVSWAEVTATLEILIHKLQPVAAQEFGAGQLLSALGERKEKLEEKVIHAPQSTELANAGPQHDRFMQAIADACNDLLATGEHPHSVAEGLRHVANDLAETPKEAVGAHIQVRRLTDEEFAELEGNSNIDPGKLH